MDELNGDQERDHSESHAAEPGVGNPPGGDVSEGGTGPAETRPRDQDAGEPRGGESRARPTRGATRGAGEPQEGVPQEGVPQAGVPREAVPQEAVPQEAGAKKPTTNTTQVDFSVPTLRHFATYTRVTQTLEAYVLASLRESRRLDHILINGRPGSGTTTLARALVRDYAPERVEELDAQDGLTTQKLLRALMRTNRRGVVLIRHIELIDPVSMQFLVNYMGGVPLQRAPRPGQGGAQRAPWETDLDRAIADSARGSEGSTDTTRGQALMQLVPGGTIIGTCLVASRLHYTLRSRFEQTINLRSDPKALRTALARVLRKHGITIAPTSFARIDRFLGTLTDGTDPLARAVLVRAGIEAVTTVDDELMQSILEDDMPTRVLDTHYAAALRDHLGGRKVKAATVEEVERIASETQWGPTAAQAAIATMLRENRARKRSEHPPSPI